MFFVLEGKSWRDKKNNTKLYYRKYSIINYSNQKSFILQNEFFHHISRSYRPLLIWDEDAH
jgi:hypothetical protein